MTFKLTIYGLAGLTVLSGFAATAYWVRRTSSDAASAKAELQTLRRDLQSVAAEAQRPRIVLQPGAPLERAQATAPVVEPTALVDVPPSREEVELEVAEAHRAQAELARAKLESEVADRNWSPRATEQLGAAFEAAEQAGVSVATKCGSTLCRVELKFDDAMAAEKSVRALVGQPPWAGATFANLSFDTKSGVVYLSREGFPLPQPPQAADL